MNILKKISLNTSLLMITIFPLTTFAAVVSNGDFSEGSSGWTLNASSEPSPYTYIHSDMSNSGFRIDIQTRSYHHDHAYPFMADESISQNIGTVNEGDTLSFDLSIFSRGYYDSYGPMYHPEMFRYMYHDLKGEVRISNNLGSQTIILDEIRDLQMQANIPDPMYGSWDINDSSQIQIELDTSLAGGVDTTLEIGLKGYFDLLPYPYPLMLDTILETTFDNIAISNANPVPVPAAAWLFGSALMGLSVVRRKK